MPVHVKLEKKLVSRIKCIHAIGEYVELLRLMYGFYQPLQQRIEPFLDGFTGRHADKIVSDIEKLEPDSAAKNHLQLCKQLPDINTHAASLGALYVTEGSTLGGQVIARMISKQLSLQSPAGFSFFKAYGNETPAKWQQFRSVLNKPRSDEERRIITDTAINTFNTFNEWISEYEPDTDQSLRF